MFLSAVANSGVEHLLPEDHTLGSSKPLFQFLPRTSLRHVWGVWDEGDVSLPRLQVSGTRGKVSSTRDKVSSMRDKVSRYSETSLNGHPSTTAICYITANSPGPNLT